MVPKLTPKIILEGTRLTFKTDIAFALNEPPRPRSRQNEPEEGQGEQQGEA
jgi:hypothetical protein